MSVRVALIGCGTVGTEVARLLLTNAGDLAARVGAPVELVGIAERSTDTERDPVIPRELLTTDWRGLVARADVVIELIGGVEPARTMILEAMAGGASVVTANKELLGKDGPTLYAAAEAAGVDLYFEAAVGGAIPLIRPVRESLAGDHITRVLGIVNGTTNYVLDQMATTGEDLALAVKQAQAAGYAEADPTADVEGFDAAAKAAILASLAFHTRVATEDVHREGISGVSADDVAWAAETGHVVKLLAVAERVPDGPDGPGGVVARVHPALVPLDHPLAGVRGAFNAVFVEAQAAGPLMFYGQGAVTRYQVRLRVLDRPGVLAQVAGAFAANDVSIETVRQAVSTGDVADLLVVTHRARESALQATVAALSGLDVVAEVLSVLRVEGA